MSTTFARLLRLMALSCIFWALQTRAAVLYVDLNSTNPVSPFSSWATAATNIQDAISAANAGDTVLVTNGTYQSGGISLTGVESNRVTITNAITVISASGPQQTIITGGPGTRCAYVGTNAILSGFTLTGGHAAAIGNGVTDQNGGGAWCEASAVVSNCIFIADVAGTARAGGGDYGGTVWNSQFTSNSAGSGGAAGNAFLYNSTASFNTGVFGAAADLCISSNCTFSSNFGSGTYFGTNFNCLISGNQGYQGGGTDQSIDYSCVISSNKSANIGGGVALGKHYNCLIVGNQATNRSADGQGGGAADAVLYNCTIVSNSAAELAGGIYDCSLFNCILYYNSAPVGPNWFNNALSNTLNYCCTIPKTGTACFTNAPLFVNPAAGLYQLQISSPCINAGNNAYVSNTTDLAGNPRISGGTVDIGAYELGFHYVAQASTNPVSPFSTWATAATNIQDAVDVASNYDEVLVSNGVYQYGGRFIPSKVYSFGLTNRLVVTNPIIVESVNGPGVTAIQGYQVPGVLWGPNAVRCAYLANGAWMIGFTLTNGGTYSPELIPNIDSGGGVYCDLPINTLIVSNIIPMVSNCVIVGNAAGNSGGGAYGGILYNCVISSNSSFVAYGGAGGASSTLINCLISGNNGGAGGAYGTLVNCVISSNIGYDGGGAGGGSATGCMFIGNYATNDGGGVYDCNLTNCTIISNTAGQAGGGAYADGGGGGNLTQCTIAGNSAAAVCSGAYRCTLDHCLISNNAASGFAAIVGGVANDCLIVYNQQPGALGTTANNCTVAFNQGRTIGAVYDGTANNCIIYSNAGTVYSNYNAANETLNFCCTFPLPTNGLGNITNNPMFVNPATGDFHLQSNSPCINAGNNAYVSATNDLDGNPRISGGTVDIGAYEFQNPASIISYAWLEQYGLPTDGSADFADPDHDGMNNYQEWRAGTDPTNPLSLLEMLSAGNTNNPPGIIVTWQSEPNINYYLQRATNLTKIPAFQTIATNLPGQSDVTSYTDTNAPAPGPYFYRVGVQ